LSAELFLEDKCKVKIENFFLSKVIATMESHSSEIEKLWHDLTPENQKELLQKFIESNKNHTSPPLLVATSQNKPTKRVLQSPKTPFKGQSRKVLIFNYF
jgi:hypothetical protein